LSPLVPELVEVVVPLVVPVVEPDDALLLEDEPPPW
jgi:hypothetical protein